MSVKFVDSHSVVCSFTLTGVSIDVINTLSFMQGGEAEYHNAHELSVNGKSREAIREALRVLNVAVCDALDALDKVES